MNYQLLQEFQALFDGKKYEHRKSTAGDRVASRLYEDLYNLGKSSNFKQRIDSKQYVLNVGNKRQGIKARRGDGTFGELIPGIVADVEAGFSVARGPIANVEIGVESKFLQKAMIKQIDRVISDLKGQVDQFHRGGGSPICVAIVGINCAPYCVSYEGTLTCPHCGQEVDVAHRTNGKGHRHPIQEAAEAERRIIADALPKFDHHIILKYSATNDPPFPFAWVDQLATFKDYGAMLTRLSRDYDTRFGP